MTGATPTAEPRYVVRPLNERLCGEGWTVYDLDEGRATGGWFAHSIAAELTAAVLNEDFEGHARLVAELSDWPGW